VRKTDPSQWRRYLGFAVLSLSLGLNFIFLTPAFLPLGIPSYLVGLAFGGSGVAQLTILTFTASGKAIRLSMAVTLCTYIFWAAALTFDYVRFSQTSMQLPMMYIALAGLGFLLLEEPFASSRTDKPAITAGHEQ